LVGSLRLSCDAEAKRHRYRRQTRQRSEEPDKQNVSHSKEFLGRLF
jgi:hypothetical protein